GITFAQDEKSAAYYDMPRSAIDNGCVDFELNPARIAEELARLARHPGALTVEASRTEESLPPFSAEAGRSDSFRQLLHLLRKANGVNFEHYKPKPLQQRIHKRMALQQLEGIDAYTNHLRQHPEEADNLYQDLFGAPRFFRDPEKYELLKRKIFPAIAK